VLDFSVFSFICICQSQQCKINGSTYTHLLVAGNISRHIRNLYWTPIFPKAAAIITDIGAPLSHAAIVARELGIPAVVGCTNATSRLKTGDKVLVDGGHGKVQILG